MHAYKHRDCPFFDVSYKLYPKPTNVYIDSPKMKSVHVYNGIYYTGERENTPIPPNV